MPNRKFLEEYSLYRKFSMDIPDELDFEALNPGQLTADQLLEKPAINMYCPVCESDQTFNMRNEYRYAFNNLALYPLFHPSYGTGVPSNFAPAAHLLYQCALCRQSLRHFMIKFDLANKYVMKVGQEPSPDISINPALEKSLGSRAGLYRKGRLSEVHGFGMGAFAYYRRIVEEVIDDLLEDIPPLMAGEERDEYLKALEQAKDAKVTKDKNRPSEG